MAMSFRLKTIVGIAAIEAALLVTLVWSGLGYIQTTNETALNRRASDTALMFSTNLKNYIISWAHDVPL